MFTSRRLTEVLESAKEVSFNDSSKFILFSDCHRGDGSRADDFAHNQNLFFHALNHYYKEGFTYIEIGDGDELWENPRLADIIRAYSNIFCLMAEFHREERLYLIWGNHDAARKRPINVLRSFDEYYDKDIQSHKLLFEGLESHEGLVLRHSESEAKIFLVHGHQGDLINDQLWRLGRFFVRHVWRHLQLLGVRDPTSPAKNFKKRRRVEQKLIQWVKARGQMLIAGHTHRPAFPDQGEPPYFNDGSCVHPRCITGIEIQNNHILLVKWWVKPDDEGALHVTREVLAGPKNLRSYLCSTVVPPGHQDPPGPEEQSR